MQIEANGANLIELLSGPKADHTVGKGLYLSTNGKGAGSWKYQYKRPISGSKNRLTYGKGIWVKPGANKKKELEGFSLADAIQAHNVARGLLANSIDPGEIRDQQRAEQQAEIVGKVAEVVAAKALERDNKMRKAIGKPPLDSFADVADRYFDAMVRRFDQKTITAGRGMIKNHANPWFGIVHINAVVKQDIANMDSELRDVKQLPKALKKVRQHVSQIMDWALHPKQNLRTKPNPVFDDEDLYIFATGTKSHAALTEIEDIRRLMIAIDGPALTDPRPSTAESLITQQYALRFIARTGQRSNNVYTAEKAEFDLDAGLWTIPALKMKGEKLKKLKNRAKDHVVYLSRQTVELLREQFARFPANPWVFPGSKAGCHMDKEKLRHRLADFGFAGKHTPHGFRAMMRTAGQEHAGLSPLVLETMLAHEDAKQGAQSGAALAKLAKQLQNMLDGGMGATYARQTESMKADFAQQSREVAQGWSDWLAQLVRPKLALVA